MEWDHGAGRGRRGDGGYHLTSRTLYRAGMREEGGAGAVCLGRMPLSRAKAMRGLCGGLGGRERQRGIELWLWPSGRLPLLAGYVVWVARLAQPSSTAT